jgi:hypothetical protein
LQWALRFAQEDFSELHAGDILNRRLELTAFASPDWYWRHADDHAPMPVATRDDVFTAHQMFQTAITKGIELLPAGFALEIVLDEKKRPEFKIAAEDGRYLAFWKFGELINEFRDQLRRCADTQCGHWFIGPKGKEYCSTQCVNRVAKDRERHPERYAS